MTLTNSNINAIIIAIIAATSLIACNNGRPGNRNQGGCSDTARALGICRDDGGPTGGVEEYCEAVCDFYVMCGDYGDIDGCINECVMEGDIAAEAACIANIDSCDYDRLFDCIDDGGEDGPDGGDGFGSGSCGGECSAIMYTACTCAASDPCNWANDDYCDQDLCAEVVGMGAFDDSADCSDDQGW